jgi:hypothetical protein
MKISDLAEIHTDDGRPGAMSIQSEISSTHVQIDGNIGKLTYCLVHHSYGKPFDQ